LVSVIWLMTSGRLASAEKMNSETAIDSMVSRLRRRLRAKLRSMMGTSFNKGLTMIACALFISA